MAGKPNRGSYLELETSLCLPVMVRLWAAATLARMAGRAILVASELARREEAMREAIVMIRE